ncbi:MAG: energy-coupled thiamine transporter ThiT [Caldisericia bacterium]|jgi:thiamine transporter|nr:energy-coupled thiamine transporter ThiT [Caldisericia bacterium]
MQNFFEAFNEFFSNPTVHTIIMVIMIILSALFLGIVLRRKERLTSRQIAEIGLALALSTILSEIKISGFWAQGGSVTAASLVPIMIIAFRYGGKIGLTVAIIHGLIQLIIGPYVVHPIQLLLDYPIAFGMVGLCGFFPKNKILGITIGLLGRFLMHFISGIIYFAQYAPEGWNPAYYSFIYNISYIAPEIIISIIVFKLAGERLVEILKQTA